MNNVLPTMHTRQTLNHETNTYIYHWMHTVTAILLDYGTKNMLIYNGTKNMLIYKILAYLDQDLLLSKPEYGSTGRANYKSK
jgi:hypothetical protein